MAKETTLSAIAAARSIERMPSGERIPIGLAHTLLVLATYYPHIWPAQRRLMADLKIDRRNLNRRLRSLEDAGLIRRTRRGDGSQSTVYWLDLRLIRDCGSPDENGGQTTPMNGGYTTPNVVVTEPPKDQLRARQDDALPDYVFDNEGDDEYIFGL